jgi:hypothetical protein
MAWVDIKDYRFPGGWTDAASADSNAREACRQLEGGGILYFDRTPFELPEDDRTFLLSQKQSTFKGHKNVSYRPKTDLLRGAQEESPEAIERLRGVMRNYSKQVVDFVGAFLKPYAGKWHLDFASFRPVEEQNRGLTLHKRNDLVHVDAFPSRPTHGGRILRVFTNINPSRPRIWETTDGFVPLAQKYANDAGLPKFAASSGSTKEKLMRTFTPVFRTIGVKGTDRSAYDRFMLRFHDYLKENEDYQKNYPKERTEFPPGATWMCYTDTVPHAVMSGQYMMEQTFIIPLQAMVAPESAPIRVLEKICGKQLAASV